MKYLRIITVFLFLLGLMSCENELNVNDDWSDITVVYGILDRTQDTNWVRIHRAWLGQDKVSIGAQSPDSIYYAQTLLVQLEELNASGEIVHLIDLIFDNTSRELEEGEFTTEEYRLYRTSETLKADTEYRLRIQKNNGKPDITATTRVLEDDLRVVRPTPAQLIALEPLKDYTIQFDTQEGSKIFQTYVTLRYKEHPIGQPGQLSYHEAVARLPVTDVNNTDGDVRVIVGYNTESLLQSFRNEIPFDPGVWRYFQALDFTVLAGDEDLHTFINVNQPATGIVSERPDFSNIEGGYGLFASRALNGRYNKSLNEAGLNNLILSDLTCDLNFVKVTTTDTCWCDQGNLACQ